LTRPTTLTQLTMLKTALRMTLTTTMLLFLLFLLLLLLVAGAADQQRRRGSLRKTPRFASG
jgi:sensor domain CHASE-containing protein